MPTIAYGPDVLNIETAGPPDADADPVVLLHGWGSQAANLQGLAQALAGTRRTYAVDLPGHGDSPPPPEPWGVPEHAELVHMLITEHVLPETDRAAVTLLGHSNGGRIALHMASTTPFAEPLARLVLISPSGMEPARSVAQRVRAGTAQALKAPFTVLPDGLREPALDWLQHTLLWRALGSSDYNALDGVMRKTFVRTVNHHVDTTVDAIAVPVLLFWGTADTAVSRQQMERLEAALPDAGLVELEGAGHYGHLDQPDTVVSATRYFLAHS
jgi:pimeloyl-ACP methyl ester carboxylesterase